MTVHCFEQKIKTIIILMSFYFKYYKYENAFYITAAGFTRNKRKDFCTFSVEKSGFIKITPFSSITLCMKNKFEFLDQILQKLIAFGRQ